MRQTTIYKLNLLIMMFYFFKILSILGVDDVLCTLMYPLGTTKHSESLIYGLADGSGLLKQILRC